MPKDTRFNVIFAADGATMTYWAGAEAPAVLNLTKLSSSVHRAASQLGFKTAIVNTCAGAVKAGWSDAECMAQMRRRAAAWINDQWTVSDGSGDFHDMVTASLKVAGLAESARPQVEAILSKLTNDQRADIRRTHAKEIAEARLERLQAAPTPEPTGGKTLAELLAGLKAGG